MAISKYWRISNINCNGSIRASELSFINTQKAPTYDRNLKAYSNIEGRGVNRLTDNNIHTYFESDGFPLDDKTRYWISCEFDYPVEVTHIGALMKVPSEGSSWSSCDVEYSKDGVLWEKVGTCTFTFVEGSEILSQAPVVSMGSVQGKWFSTLGAANCLYALDSDTEVNATTGEVTFSNGVKGTLINKSDWFNTTVDVKPFSHLENKSSTGDVSFYRYLNVEGGSIKFERAPVLPGMFTIIFVGEPLRNMSLWRALPEGGDQAPIIYYEEGGGGYRQHNSYGYGKWWQFSVGSLNFSEQYGSYTYRRDEGYWVLNEWTSKLGKQVFVFKSNTFSGDAEVKTFYTSVKGVMDSGLKNQLRQQEFQVVGGTPSYPLNSNIIAYGMFDRWLEDTEVQQLLDKIDEQFLVNKESFPESSMSAGYEPVEISANLYVQEREESLPEWKPLYKEIGEFSVLWEEEWYIKDMQVGGLYDIEDYVYEEEVPISTKLMLIERLTGKLVGTTTSREDGYFTFKDVPSDRDYIVIAPHGDYQYDSILKDYVKTRG